MLNKGGKYAWEKLKQISNLIKKHPTKSALTIAYAWYVLDPESFNEEVKKSGKRLTNFILTSFGSFASGTGEAVVEKTQEIKKDIEDNIKQSINTKAQDMKNSISNNNILNFIVGIFIFIVLFVIWRKRKIIKQFILKADEVKKEKQDTYRRDDEY